MHEMGDAQLTRTTSGTISLERNDVRRHRQVIPEGNAPMMRRKFALARITERCCILAANVCTGMEIDKCKQTECGSIRKSTVRTKPTTSSADGTTLPRGEWASGADGICTTQPSVNMEIVPAQQPAQVVRKAHVFDEVADGWREILEVVSMPISEPDTPHTTSQLRAKEGVELQSMQHQVPQLQHLEATPNCGARHEYKKTGRKCTSSETR